MAYFSKFRKNQVVTARDLAVSSDSDGGKAFYFVGEYL